MIYLDWIFELDYSYFKALIGSKFAAFKAGKIDTINHKGTGIFEGILSPIAATRYHSLTVLREGLPNCLRITAESPDGVIQGLSHKTRPVHGVQFHPESIASEHGHDILKNFINLTKGKLA